ncbi:HNH endonuclease signature motif containing protein [Agrococcus sp. SGAir0287]|uniref:HNH endonuclease signature motif containing protein n=1 Tax=Agrococcus sp. SGAir0287 TaxID=2070347 RepID=UPI00158602AD|nr:HNH endonuclease signature motif containing protein [Agrococcus sp. SGAir0287]
MRDEATVETAVVDALLAGRESWSGLLDAELLTVVDELAARRRAIDAALARATAEMARRSDDLPPADALVRRAGHRSAAEMLQQRVGLRSREARVLCAVADATRSTVSLSGATIAVPFPHVAAALSAGWISLSQAHAIVEPLQRCGARVAPADVEIAERDLVARAIGAAEGDASPQVPEALSVLARRWLDHLDPDGEEPRYDEQLAGRFLRLRRMADGSVRGELRCTPEVGDAIQTVLDAEVRPRRVTFAACDGDAEAEEERDDRTLDQRRMDALAAIVAHHGASASPRVCGEAATLTIVTTADALHGEPASPDDRPWLRRSGDIVPVAVAAALLCDAFVQPVLQGDDGEVLRLGRRRRLFSTSQRRAIVARDRHCRAPGCSAPAGWCETHHVVRWADGGVTDVANGILLCRFHHTEVHRGALEIRPVEDRPKDGAIPEEDAMADAGHRPPRPRSRAERLPALARWRVTSRHRRRPRTRTPIPMRT